MINYRFSIFAALIFVVSAASVMKAQPGVVAKPNIILIYTDDLGYGDIGANGATRVKTPNIDRLAKQGLRLTNAHATSATCTPSRFSVLTGRYAWRKSGTGIAPGDASLLIPPGTATLPGMLKKAGYRTAVVGKWHLGLGGTEGPDWNADVKPGPLEIGFDYCFIMPATADRVPCVYLENHRIVDLDPADPITVSYKNKIGNDPTGKENPELLKLKPSHGHDNTIVNGVSRIGWMTGGNKARWIDEDMANVFTHKAISFIKNSQKSPFFLYFATHDIHVPRVPNSRFVGKSGMGARGDAILQLDWTVGEVLKALDDLGIADNTLLVFTSDNGPVLDDGYQDQAAELAGSHAPAGTFRGGKYSAFEAGTRVPFLVRWPGKIKPGSIAGALFSQVDLFASFAALTGQPLAEGEAPDSFNSLAALTGKAAPRAYVIEQSLNNTLSLIRGSWKYIEPSRGPKIQATTNTELGNDPSPQLYDMKTDTGEKNNLADARSAETQALAEFLQYVKNSTSTRSTKH
ncbi:sulfatase family protein [Hufsiella ginkgonis]|uniref:Sulfatase-like hydrolase/transferase n=1 Tax=Hufsiella ginkgonis TaxID=2695274 RepID=A0A7K1XS06_9SPHI|nr:arylsulfatase [Hufsiella ginkgonis]MXV13782.1 sulfatase-like hydrolase/transferase [Hufsiella ginkgonis]